MFVILIYFDETKSLISEFCSGWNIGVKITIAINETNISIGSAAALLSKFAVNRYQSNYNNTNNN